MFKEFGQIASLLKNLPRMQEEMAKVQSQLGHISVEGDAGAGMVKVKINGHLEIQKLILSDEALKNPDKELLEDLIAAAVNQGLRKAKQAVAEETSKVAGGLGLPMPPGAFNP